MNRNSTSIISLLEKFWHRIRKSPDLLPLMFFFGVSLFLMAPLLLHGGYFLQFDYIIGPDIHLDINRIQTGEQLPNSMFYNAIFWFLSLFLPTFVIQKLVLFSIVFGGLLVVYRATASFSRLTRAAGASLYVLNPFVYDRMMAGHWALLIGYMLLPYFLFKAQSFWNRPSRDGILKLSIIWSIAATLSGHMLVIYGLVWLTITLVQQPIFKAFLLSSKVVLYVLLLNSWWIVWLMASNNVYESLNGTALGAFQTRADQAHGLLFNMVTLQGFWVGAWRSVKDYFSFWPFLSILWLSPVLVGVWQYLSQRKIKTGMVLIVLSAISLMLAAGSYPTTYSFNTFLFVNVPGLVAFREPQKLLSILAITYLFFVLHGLEFLQRQYRKFGTGAAIATVVLSLLLVRPWWYGFDGQVRLTEFPGSWYALQAELKSDDHILVLPWSLYITNSFAGNIVAQPAIEFFGPQAIVNTDPKLSGVPDPSSPENMEISVALEAQDIDALQRIFKERNIGYVLLVNSFSSQNYAWIMGDWPPSTAISDDLSTVIKVLTH